MKQLAQQACRAISQYRRWAVDFVYPPVCPLCYADVPGETADSTSVGPVLCDECQSAVAPPIPHSCLRCGAAMGPFLKSDQGCVYCRKDRFAFESVVRLGMYGDLLRKACQRIKGRGTDPLAAALAQLLWMREEPALREVPIDVVVAIPHHWSQRITRGHNAAETVATVLARRLQLPFGRHILSKVRRTPAQTSLSSRDRRRNLKGAFHVARGVHLTDATILLVDDVLTTGTTAHVAAKTLRARGAKRVIVGVLARSAGGPAKV